MWKLMWKIKWWTFKEDLYQKAMRRKYCHKGYHKLKTGWMKHWENGKNEEIHYLRCIHCNWIFFASLRQKNKYLRMTARERSAFRRLLSGPEAEH